MSRPLSRRQFCLASGAGMLALHISGCGADESPPKGEGGVRDMASPPPPIDQSVAPIDFASDPTCPVNGKVAAGSPSAIALNGARFFNCARVFVCRDGSGLYAMTSACTHEGCDVGFNSSTLQFDCPCHQSVFDFNGNVVHDPAPAPLPHLALGFDGGGNLVVDVMQVVPAGTRLLDRD
jgi:Rieske Fe-S protein